MKLRIKGNSLRLRLTQGEVRQLDQQGQVEDYIHFGPSREQAIGYTVESSEREPKVRAIFSENKIRVLLPFGQAREFVETDQVGLEETQEIAAPGDSPRELRLIIEKDFQCLKPRFDEDESDHYPNPQGSH